MDCTAAFAGLGSRERSLASVSVQLTPHTYLPRGELTEGWFPNILGAFRELRAALAREGRRPKAFASIGVGPGLDAIAAVEILGVDRLYVTDVHQDVVDTARTNVLANCPGISAAHVTGMTGDLCEGLLAEQVRVDVLYENLPNLPTDARAVREGAMTASFFDAGRVSAVPEIYSRRRLGLHYLFLSQGRPVLTAEGCVVCCIGGRVPAALVRAMFVELGYRPEVINYEIVRQFESDKVLAAYADAERLGGDIFTFYPFYEAREALSRLRDSEPEATVDVAIQDPRLQSLAMDARQALAHENGGHAIGHLGMVWRGRHSTSG
jgi:hypothetical protein